MTDEIKDLRMHLFIQVHRIRTTKQNKGGRSQVVQNNTATRGALPSVDGSVVAPDLPSRVHKDILRLD